MSRSRARSKSRSRLWSCIEKLERRTLLSLAPAGAEFRANNVTLNQQTAPAVAVDGDGDFVVAWQSQNQDGSGYGIFARRYNFNGIDLTVEAQVNTFTTGHQTAPAIAMDGDGDFVVVWQSAAQDGSGQGVYGRRFDPRGLPLGNEFRVNVTTSADQQFPAVAMDSDGDFVVAWTSRYQDGSGDGIYARRYRADGVPAGGEFRVNNTTDNNQYFPAVAMDAEGDFVVAWQAPEADFYLGVWGRRYNAAGAAQGNEFRVNTFTTGDQTSASVAMDHSGEFVVAWESFAQDGSGRGIYAQRYSGAGAAQGGEFRVNTATAGGQAQPSVGIDADGDFFIAWSSTDFSGSYGIYAQAYAGGGSPQGGEFRVNTFTSFNQHLAAVAMEPGGDLIVTWYSDGQDGSSHGVYGQRYAQTPDTAPPTVTEMAMEYDPIREGERLVEHPQQIVFNFSEPLSTAGGSSGPNSASNVANYALFHNGVDISHHIEHANFFNNVSVRKFQTWLTFFAPLPDGNYLLTAKQALQDEAGNALDGNFDGAPGGDFSRAFSVLNPVAAGLEFRVNTFTTQIQSNAAVASDAAGNFVVTWGGGGNQDGSGFGIFAQRYNAAGVPQGAEFRVNTFTTNIQDFPSIAMDDAGNFVIAWQSLGQDGSGFGIVAQRFDAAGVPQGSEFAANVATANDQTAPTVAMSGDGGQFVIAWTGDQADDVDDAIVARRFAGNGQPLGGEFVVNVTISGDQNQPAAAMDYDGDFAIAWTSGPSTVPDPRIDDIYARRYDAEGRVQGGEILVNTFTTSDQFSPAIAMDDEGDFVVAWTSFPQDAPLTDGVYAQRFSAGGIRQGPEIPVNTFTTGNQFAPTVGMDGDGDFVIAWNSRNQEDPANIQLGIFAQRFRARGSREGDEFHVNTYTTSDQRAPAAALDADGDFVIAWDSFGQDGSSNGIFAQRYASDVPAPAVSASSFLFATAPHRLTFTFNTDVSASLGTEDIVLENLTTMQTIPSTDLALAYDSTTNTATFTYVPGGGALPDGRYRATLVAAGITNASGTPMAADYVHNFVFLRGDPNNDGRVNLTDFNILAQNFGQSPRDFTQGDFNYDSTVNLTDFNILAARFGQTLGAEGGADDDEEDEEQEQDGV